jgi:hypothetical protein
MQVGLLIRVGVCIYPPNPIRPPASPYLDGYILKFYFIFLDFGRVTDSIILVR